MQVPILIYFLAFLPYVITSPPRPKWSVPAVPCRVHCRSTAAHAVYLQYILLIHCWHTADCSVHCAYTVYTLHLHCSDLVIQEWQRFYTLHMHCQHVAVYLQPTLQLHWNYTAYTLHFGLGLQQPMGLWALHIFRSVSPRHWQWPAPMGSWRVYLY